MHPLDLPLRIVAGPVEDIVGLPEMVGIERAHGKIDKEGFGRAGKGQVESELLVAQARAGVADHAKRRIIHAIGYAVALVVKIEKIGGGVAVGRSAIGIATTGGDKIGAEGAGSGHITQPRAFDPIGQAIAIAVGVERVEIPPFAVKENPLHLKPIADQVIVGINVVGAGPKFVDLGFVAQAVIIAIRIDRCIAVGKSCMLHVACCVLRVNKSAATQICCCVRQRVKFRVEVATGACGLRGFEFILDDFFAVLACGFDLLARAKGVELLGVEQWDDHHRANDRCGQPDIDAA